jgi:hypothetical protein
VTREAHTGSVGFKGGVIRYKTQEVDGRTVLTSLVVEVAHLDFPADARRFDLSHLIASTHQFGADPSAADPEASHAAKLPRALEQIIAPEVLDETRFDALGVFLKEICKVSLSTIQGEVIAPSTEGDPTQGAGSVSQGSPFTIQRHNKTTLEEVLKGANSWGLTVLRLGHPLVEFFVREGSAGIVDAEIRILPLGLRWPLLDHDGAVVTIKTINAALFDFYTFLRETETFPAWVSLGRLAIELDQRRYSNDTPGTSAPLHYTQLERARGNATMDGAEDLYPLAAQPVEVEHVLTNRRGGAVYEMRAAADISIRVGLCGDPALGAGVLRIEGSAGEQRIPYAISLDGSRKDARALAEARERLARARQVKEVNAALYALTQVPSLRVCCQVSNDPSRYPSEVNALIGRMQQQFGTCAMGRGMLAGDASRNVPPSMELIKGLMCGGGMVPVWGAVAPPDQDVANRWIYQGFIDPSMNATLYLRNPLGTTIQLLLTTGAGRNSGVVELPNLAQVLEALYDAPDEFLKFLGNNPTIVLNDLGLPRVTHSESFHVLRDVANRLWRAFDFGGEFASGRISRISPWKVQELAEGRWALSITSRGQDGRPTTPVFTLEMGGKGVEAFLVSAGARSLFGRLHGTRVFSRNTPVFSLEQLHQIIRFIRDPRGLDDGHRSEGSVWDSIAGSICIPATPMMEYDPRVELDWGARVLRRWRWPGGTRKGGGA